MKNYLSAFALTGVMFGTLLFTPLTSFAAPTILFEDNFDQTGSGIGANNWTSFSSAAAGSRVATSNDGFTVGVSSKGILLEAKTGADPDEAAQHELATKGFSSLHVSYSRAISGFDGAGESFVAQYSLDDGAFVDFETLTTDQAHAAVTWDIPNPERHTKLTVRFFVNGDEATDEAGIDNFELTGEDAPIFYDGFESNDFSAPPFGAWSTEKAPSVIQSAANHWTNDNSNDTGHSANLDAVNDGTDPDDAIYRTIDTTGYEDIMLRFARKVDNLGTGESYKAFVSTDGGSSWTEIHSSEDVAWSSLLFDLSTLTSGDSDDNPNLAIRFELNGNGTGDDSYTDDVVLWGNAINTPPLDVCENVPGNQESGPCDDEVCENGGGVWDGDSCEFPAGEATLTLVKIVDGGDAVADDFQAYMDGNEVDWNDPQTLEPGTYALSEDEADDYTPSEWVCEANGGGGEPDPNFAPNFALNFVQDSNMVTLEDGDDVICTITNTYDPAPPAEDVTVTLVKYIDGVHAIAETADSLAFPMTSCWNADNIGAGCGAFALSTIGFNNPNPYEATTSDMSNGADYSAEETLTGDNVGASCGAGKPFALVGYTLGTSELDAAGQEPSLTPPSLTDITSDMFITVWNETCPTLTLVKTVVNNNDGEADADDFQAYIDGNAVPWGVPQIVSIGSHTASEDTLTGYTPSDWGSDCASNGSVTLAAGEDLICTITNDDDAPAAPAAPPADACDTPLVAPLGYTLVNGTPASNIVTIAPFTMFVGKGGSDIVTANQDGNYIICTQGGSDTIRLNGNGDFTISAGAGTNIITTKNGNGTIITGNGSDMITTGAGVQTIMMGNGANTLKTGNGDKAVTGGTGFDNVTTGSGNDTISVGSGVNNVNSGSGDDAITGGANTDIFNGGPGFDTCAAGGGFNSLTNCEA